MMKQSDFGICKDRIQLSENQIQKWISYMVNEKVKFILDIGNR